MTPYVVGITGASGVVYGIRFVQVLTELGHDVHLVVSKAARLVMEEKLGFSPKNLADGEAFRTFFESSHLQRMALHANEDLAAPIASGSFPTRGMVIIPCSTGTLGCVAGGISTNLIQRAAECTLKEGRRLVIVPRETPVSAIQLENMLKLARLGVRVLPANPAFYAGAKTIQDLVDFVVGKTLDALEIPHGVYPRWTGRTVPTAA